MAWRTATSQIDESHSPHPTQHTQPTILQISHRTPPHTFHVCHVIDHCRFSLLHQAVSLQLAVPPTPPQFRDRGRQHRLPYDWAWCDIRFGNLVTKSGMQGISGMVAFLAQMRSLAGALNDIWQYSSEGG